ncbi:MAG: phosphoribosyltransferase [Haloquadratum sp.]|nr:phosphoribosyltransferase [Haloferacaceae archaeon]MDR9444564.1 phosphoribosyltransferase [Haloquadratum sp.]
MSELPERFPCTITTWDYIYGLCRRVSEQVRADTFAPDVVVALARGGWFAGRCMCDFLGLDDLTSLKVEHYVGTAARSGDPSVRYPLAEGSVRGKDVLIVDDIADTGGSLRRAESYVRSREVAEVRTATLQLLGSSAVTPTYIGEALDEWAWIVYPWNFIEDMSDLIAGVIQKDAVGSVAPAEIRRLLAEYHEIDPIAMEIAQPDRLEEVLTEMVRRGLLAEGDGGRYRLIPP